MKKRIIGVVTSIILVLVLITTVNAVGNVDIELSGSDSININENITLSFNVNSVEGSSDGKLYSFGGYVNFDPTYLQYVSFTGSNGWTGLTGGLSSNRIKISSLDFSMSNGISSGTIGTITFKAIKGGNTTITMDTIEATDKEKNLDCSVTPKTITIIDPNAPALSDDSSLRSLTVNGYSLTPEFNSAILAYSMNVDNDVTSLNIEAIPNDENATASIEGGTNLVVGENTVTITVTAEDESVTVYTIIVNRQDALSSNTDISLTINTNHTIDPSFSNSVDTYAVSVPSDTESLDLTVTPVDENASAIVTDNENFTDGINPVTITVTAEDGTIRVITLNVTRDLSNLKKGDINRDGKVNLLDIRIMLQKSINHDYDDEERWIMDYTGDDKATLLDVRLFLQDVINHRI